MRQEPTLFIPLYIDEDVHEGVAQALRRHGYDAQNVREARRRGFSDAEQLVYATSEGRVLFSFNVTDYVALHLNYLTTEHSHAGIIVARQIPIGETVRRLLSLLDHVTADEMHNQLRWLPPLPPGKS